MNLDNIKKSLENNSTFPIIDLFSINFHAFTSENKNISEKMNYKKFLTTRETLLPPEDNFYSYFLYINSLQSINEKYLHVSLTKFFETIEEEDFINRLIHNYIIYIFSLFQKSQLTKEFRYIEEKLLKLIPESKKIQLINSTMLIYLTFIKLTLESLNIGILRYFLRKFLTIQPQEWKSLYFPDKELYFILCFYIYETINNKNLIKYDSYSVFLEASRFFKEIDNTPYYLIFKKAYLDLKSEIFVTNPSHHHFQELLTTEEHICINRIFNRIKNFRKPITLDHIYMFLNQFDSLDNVRSFIKIMDKIDFYNYWNLNEILESTLIEKIKPTEKQNIILCPLECEGSSQIYQYMISHNEKINQNYHEKIKYKSNLKEALIESNEDDIILIIDDCTISGTQTSSIIGDIFGRERTENHTKYCDQLSDENLSTIRNRKILFVFCIGSSFAQEKIKETLTKYEVNNFEIHIGKYLDLSEEAPASRAFSINSLIWDSPEERERLKFFCKQKGFEVLEKTSERKNWTGERAYRREQSSLGYSDLQLLIVFPYSVPKTTLTLLWCESENWKPLFPNT